MTYAEIQGHPPDFEVHYRFFTREEGGRISGPPGQHYRCEWAYADDAVFSATHLHMIYPEFTAEDGSILPEGVPVPWSGTATMWVSIPEMRAEFHCARIVEGVRGYFMESIPAGRIRRIAEAVVSRVIGLHTNPDGRPK